MVVMMYAFNVLANNLNLVMFGLNGFLITATR